MRRVMYSVAMSLDGYIATEDGGYDWIPDEPAIDWGAFVARFDTVLLGRKTYEVMMAQGQGSPYSGMRQVVFSRTLKPADHPEVEIATDLAAVRDLRNQSGKGIWLVGGGELFRSLLAESLVDAVEVAIVPILLGRGIPGLPPTSRGVPLKLVARHEYPSGIVLLTYEVVR